jgi:NAD dependent epimerase/dehydratase
MTNQKVLVTGAGGFIGSHVTENLVREGYQVKAFVQYNSLNNWEWLECLEPSILSEVEVFSGDIRDPFGVKKAMESCSKVLHLAALIGIPYSYHSPENYLETNVKGTLNIVQAARELEIERVIHTSTSEVYGTAQYVPIDENHPLQPQSPYSATKIAADQIAMSYYYAFNSPVSIIRPFNTYGPRQSARAVIPTVITQISGGMKDIRLGSLTPTRDFTFVEDTARAFVKSLSAENIIGKVINLGTQFEISIENLVKTIAEIMKADVQVSCDEQRLRPKNSEVERLCSNNALARELLQWSPEYGGLDGLKSGLTKTIEWFMNERNLKLYKPGIYNV